MRVLVVGNEGDDDPGFVGERLVEHGANLMRAPRERPSSWPDLDGTDLVLVLGSEWSVYWERHRAVVAAEAALVSQAHQRGTPVFGICYGAQMLAHALGGSVCRAKLPEVGWYTVDTDAPATIGPGPWFQWHLDTFQPPAEATVLARSAVGPQAFVLGRTAAVQFHPEVDVAIVARWCQGGDDDLAAVGSTADQVIEATRAQVTTTRACEHAPVAHVLAASLPPAPAS
jgi:GMP synthase-like glutamine amidotransferase